MRRKLYIWMVHKIVLKTGWMLRVLVVLPMWLQWLPHLFSSKTKALFLLLLSKTKDASDGGLCHIDFQTFCGNVGSGNVCCDHEISKANSIGERLLRRSEQMKNYCAVEVPFMACRSYGTHGLCCWGDDESCDSNDDTPASLPL